MNFRIKKKINIFLICLISETKFETKNLLILKFLIYINSLRMKKIFFLISKIFYQSFYLKIEYEFNSKKENKTVRPDKQFSRIISENHIILVQQIKVLIYTIKLFWFLEKHFSFSKKHFLVQKNMFPIIQKTDFVSLKKIIESYHKIVLKSRKRPTSTF